MRAIYPDLEYIPADPTVSGLISIGLVDNTGREFYAINHACDLTAIAAHEWLMANVVPHLPLAPDGKGGLLWEAGHPEYRHVASPQVIAAGLEAWLQPDPDPEAQVRMYNWFGAGDVSRMHQLWGGDWNHMPRCIPRYGLELQTLADALGVEVAIPEEREAPHRAVDDARQHRIIHQLLVAHGGLAAAL